MKQGRFFMLNYLWAGMIAVGIVYGVFSGNMEAVTNGALDSAKEAISLCLNMCGVMALWMGLMEIAQTSGLIERMTIAILFIAVCYAVMAAIGFSIDLHVTDKINLLWMILFEIILAISELFFSVAGYTMVSELAPNNYFSLFLGIFLATRSAKLLTTWLAEFISLR